MFYVIIMYGVSSIIVSCYQVVEVFAIITVSERPMKPLWLMTQKCFPPTTVDILCL